MGAGRAARARQAGAVLARGAASTLLCAALTATLLGAATLGGCGPAVGRSAVSFQLKRGTAPPDAQVYIDEQLVGPLSYVAAHGVRLPIGEHRVTVTRTGYFPWDRLVTADRKPLRLVVEMEPIPD